MRYSAAQHAIFMSECCEKARWLLLHHSVGVIQGLATGERGNQRGRVHWNEKRQHCVKLREGGTVQPAMQNYGSWKCVCVRVWGALTDWVGVQLDLRKRLQIWGVGIFGGGLNFLSVWTPEGPCTTRLM